MHHYVLSEQPSFLPKAPPPLTIRPAPPKEERPAEKPSPEPATEHDPDRTFLLLLLVLLVKNQAPIELILAIGYLAM